MDNPIVVLKPEDMTPEQRLREARTEGESSVSLRKIGVGQRAKENKLNLKIALKMSKSTLGKARSDLNGK